MVKSHNSRHVTHRVTTPMLDKAKGPSSCSFALVRPRRVHVPFWWKYTGDICAD